MQNAVLITDLTRGQHRCSPLLPHRPDSGTLRKQDRAFTFWPEVIAQGEPLSARVQNREGLPIKLREDQEKLIQGFLCRFWRGRKRFLFLPRSTRSKLTSARLVNITCQFAPTSDGIGENSSASFTIAIK
jgi:hypothetical protein